MSDNAHLLRAEWHLLGRDGEELPEAPRPPGAQPRGEWPGLPWFNLVSHIHVDDGEISGTHFQGTLEEAKAYLRRALEREQYVLSLPRSNNRDVYFER